MADQIVPHYDVYISYAPADSKWVKEWLVLRLSAAGVKVAVDYEVFIIGKPHVDNIESAINSSHRVIVVLTPEWVEHQWNEFEAVCVRFVDPLALQRKLLPLLLRPCAIPEWIQRLECADFHDKAQWEREFHRLLRDIEDTIPLPPLKKIGIGAFLWRWLRRYRRGVRWFTIFIFALLLLLFIQSGWPPFQPRTGWQALGPIGVEGVSHLFQVDGTLYVTTHTDITAPQNTKDSGLWHSTDGGQQWTPLSPPLHFTSTQGEALAEIHDLATTQTKPRSFYAATSHVGVLRLIEGQNQWENVTAKPLPSKVSRLGVAPYNGEMIFAAAQEGGLYRSSTAGRSWEQLDLADRCKSGQGDEFSLHAGLLIGALQVTEKVLYVGTASLDASAAPHAGLYSSRDQGNCWRLHHDGKERYGYKALMSIPGEPASLLALVYNFAATPDEPPILLWKLMPDGPPQTLWSSKAGVADRLLVSQGSRPHWYVVTDGGWIYSGALDAAAGDEKRLWVMTRCLLICEDVDLALAEDGKTPLLLAGNRVYRSAPVLLPRLLWP